MKHRLLLGTLALMFAMTSNATIWQIFKINNLNYQVTSEDASTLTGTVIVWNGGFSGDLVIPSSISYNSFTYTVTEIESEYYIDDEGEIEDCDGGAFMDADITSLVIPNTIVKIGEYAFDNCSKLTTVYIPASVKKIGLGAFQACSGLTSLSVDADNTIYDSRYDCNAIIETASNSLIQACNATTIIPESVTSIKNGAFSNCNSLTSITIPNSVTTIGNNTFSRCYNLTEVNIGSGLTNVGNWIFNNCNNLSTITIDSGNTFIDSREDCNAIIETATNTLIIGCKNTTIPNSVTSIGDNAFYGCTGMISITIPGSVTTIGKSSFYNCSNLADVTIENGVSTIGDNAFQNCNNLKMIDIPTSVTKFDRLPFSWNLLKEIYVHWDTPITLTQDIMSIYTSTTLIVPTGKVNAYKNANYWKKFTNIVAENGAVGSSFVQNNLKYIILNSANNSTPGTVSVGANTKSLTDDVQIPEQVTYLNKKFNVTTIRKEGFYACKDISNISIPNSVTSIGEAAFRGCYSLGGTLNIPGSVKIIGKYAFRDCRKLSNIVFNEGLERIEDDAFHTMNGGGVDAAEYNYFVEVTTINIPSTVSYIGTNFYNYDKLTNIFVDDNNQYYCDIDGVLYSKDLKTICKFPVDKDIDEEYVLPNEVKTIGDYCFDQTKIKSLVLPDTMEYIGKYAFYRANYLKKIKMPEYLQDMGISAFNCENNKISENANEHLEYVKLPAGLTRIPGNCFLGCPNLRVIKIPNSVKLIESEIIGIHESQIPIVHITLPTYFESMDNMFHPINQQQPAGHLYSLFLDSGSAFISEITIPKSAKHLGNLLTRLNIGENHKSNEPGNIKAVYIIGDELPDVGSVSGMFSCDGRVPAVKGKVYFKKSVFFDKFSDGTCSFEVVNSPEADRNPSIFEADYRIPVSMTNNAGNPIEYKTLCRDFDVDLTHTNDNLPEGVEPLRAYLVEDVDGELRYVFLNEIKYIPSRLKANVTDENGNLYQGVDEYVGVVLRGTPGYTYYYEMGEHDYTQGAEGQWLMDEAMAYSNSYFDQNLMAGDANDEFYIHKTVKDEDDNDITNYGLNNNKFKIYYKDGWLNYNKSYLQLPKDVSDAIEKNTDAEGNANLTFIFNNADGSTDKVSSVEFNRNSESDIFYNPYGQRVNANTKGIVINNGKKYVNK